MNKKSVFITLNFLVFVLFSTAVKSGDYDHAIDKQSEVMGKIMRDFGTVKGDIQAYWQNMPERERHLRSAANKAVDNFKQQMGRYPTFQDRGFFISAWKKAGVRNQAEAELMISQMDSYIRGGRDIEAIEDDMCAAARQYTEQGFGYIYRNIMPECF